LPHHEAAAGPVVESEQRAKLADVQSVCDGAGFPLFGIML
jgi:hypothetical protein